MSDGTVYTAPIGAKWGTSDWQEIGMVSEDGWEIGAYAALGASIIRTGVVHEAQIYSLNVQSGDWSVDYHSPTPARVVPEFTEKAIRQYLQAEKVRWDNNVAGYSTIGLLRQRLNDRWRDHRDPDSGYVASPEDPNYYLEEVTP